MGRKPRESLASNARRGHSTGGKTYGYRAERVGDHTELRVCDEEAAVVLRVFEACAAGDGDGKVAAALNRDGVRSATGAGRTKRTVAWMLRNELYAA